MNSTSPHTPPDTEEKCVSGPGAAPSLVVFDTSDLTRSPSGHTPTWKGRQRHLDQKLQPRVLHEQWTSRKDRRATGDRRTAQQIAESIRSGQERS